MINYLSRESARGITDLSLLTDANFVLGLLFIALLLLALKVLEKFLPVNEDWQMIKVVAKIHCISVRQLFERAFEEAIKTDGLPPEGTRRKIIDKEVSLYRLSHLPPWYMNYRPPPLDKEICNSTARARY